MAQEKKEDYAADAALVKALEIVAERFCEGEREEIRDGTRMRMLQRTIKGNPDFVMRWHPWREGCDFVCVGRPNMMIGDPDHPYPLVCIDADHSEESKGKISFHAQLYSPEKCEAPYQSPNLSDPDDIVLKGYEIVLAFREELRKLGM